MARMSNAMFLALTLAALCGCGHELPTEPLGDSLEQLRGAPASVTLDGVPFTLQAFVNRDFMPVSDTRLRVFLNIHTPPGMVVPLTVFADRVWVTNGAEIWASSLQNNPDQGRNAYFARGGPTWDIGTTVDVVVQLRNIDGRTALLALRGGRIDRSD